MTDNLATYFLVTEPTGVRNLLRESIVDLDDDGRRVFYVGNPMIDTLFYMMQQTATHDALTPLGLKPHKFILMTIHRGDNVDTEPALRDIVALLEQISQVRAS